MTMFCDNASTIHELNNFPLDPPCPPPFLTYANFHEHAMTQGLQNCDVRDIATLCNLHESDMMNSESDSKDSIFWASWRGYLIIASAVFVIPIVTLVAYRKFCRRKVDDEKTLSESSQSDEYSNEGYQRSPNPKAPAETPGNKFECKVLGTPDVKCDTKIKSEKL